MEDQTHSEKPLADDYHTPRTVDELTQRNVSAVSKIDQAEQARRTPTDRAVDAITGFCGSMAFVWVHTAWFGLWVLANIFPGLPKAWRFDPYPFQLLTLVVSLEAIFLSTFILISQNRQGRLAERRNRLDLQVNLLSEQENTKVLSMLEAIHQRMGIDDSDPEISVLEQSTQPDRLIQQIEAAVQEETPGA